MVFLWVYFHACEHSEWGLSVLVRQLLFLKVLKCIIRKHSNLLLGDLYVI